MPLSLQKPRKSSKRKSGKARGRQAYVIKPDGTVIAEMPNNGKTFSLEELQTIVGGFIEIVALADGSVMVLNEEGKLLGLPFNAKATVLFNSPERMFYDPIMGIVLVCSKNCL